MAPGNASGRSGPGDGPAPAWPRAILHVDMDAFFAAIEVLDNPSLRGLPVIVGGTPQGHGVVSTASYEARRFGVHSAMPAARAVRLCPHGIFLRPRPGRYAAVSRRVMALLAEYSPLIEAVSIDEAFLDVTGSQRLAGPPETMARRIKQRIAEATGGLTASVGVAENKFVAKVASDLEKPDGLVVVRPGEAERLLAPLPVESIWGVGPKTAEALRARGYTRIGDLRARSEKALEAGFGEELGRHLYRLARGLDERPVASGGEPRSVSSETTLAEFLSPADADAVESLLLSLSDDVAARLRDEGARGRTVTLKVRDDRFVTRTRSATLTAPVRLAEEIRAAALRLWREKVDLAGRRLRLLGVAVSNLQFDDCRQLDLFDTPESDRAERVADAVDSIRERLGSKAILRGRFVPPPARTRGKRR